jgi:predicted transcriptional regulator
LSAFSTNNYEFKKISACVSHHSNLIYLLLCRQPLSLKEILDELGLSKQKLLRDLKQLRKYKLIVRVSFESHVLYVIDGNYNALIHSILSS